MEKNLQVKNFHFEAERPTFGYLRTQKKKVMSGNGVLPGAARTVVPGRSRSTQRGSGSPYDNGSDSESSDVPWWKILETGSWFWEVGETFERCVF